MNDLPTIGVASDSAGVPTTWPNVPGYEILGELGRGGMGVVYKARSAHGGDVRALKMLRDASLAGDSERARFRIEAEAAARMGHPNIVRIHEVGTAEGRPYLVMELIQGGGLDRRLAGRPQPAARSAELVRALALAVQHAHDQRVIHRDLKPSNVLLAPVQSGGCREDVPEGGVWTLDCARWVPKITDFGLAKRLDADSTAWTKDGAILGTPSYMAPEQAAGRVREVGPAVDVYALGSILFELLTGRPPFTGESWNETVDQVLHAEPTPPTRLQPGVPRDLETVCLKCLEKDPSRRYASAVELADELARFLDRKPVSAAPQTALDRLRRLAARDGYRILDEVGRGPRSTIYHARYEPLHQPVALKVFAAGACTRAEWDERLRRGAELWVAVAHPRVVAVHRAGWWDDAPYVALEYVPHGCLAARFKGRAAPLAEAVGLASHLADVIGYLHRQGAVHANLKPSNVLLAPDGLPRIVDFSLSGGLHQSPLPTGDEDPAGLCYLAPELTAQPPREPRPYTDVYGIGLVLYELLTGRPPFSGQTAREVLERVMSDDPPPPSTLNRQVTPLLDRVCLRCLRKNPWRRYVRAYDLARRLEYLTEMLEGDAGVESVDFRTWSRGDSRGSQGLRP